MAGTGASPLRMLLTIAAVLVAIVFVFMGQLYFAIALGAIALFLALAALFARAKTPTD